MDELTGRLGFQGPVIAAQHGGLHTTLNSVSASSNGVAVVSSDHPYKSVQELIDRLTHQYAADPFRDPDGGRATVAGQRAGAADSGGGRGRSREAPRARQ